MALDRAVRPTITPAHPPMAAASTRRCWRASWDTTSASTSSAGRQTRRPRPACRPHGEASVARYELDASGQALVAARAPAAGAACESSARFELHGPRRADSRNGREPLRRRSPDRLDPARDARAAVSGKRRDRVPRVGDAIEGLRVRRSGAPTISAGSRVRLAARAARRTAAPPTCASTPARRASSVYTTHLMDQRRQTRLLRRVFAGRTAGVWLRLGAGRFSVDGHLGGKPQPDAAAVERLDR